jgi:hypothetical protein
MAENVAMAGDERNQFLARFLMIGWITVWTILGMLIGAGSLMIYLAMPGGRSGMLRALLCLQSGVLLPARSMA